MTSDLEATPKAAGTEHSRTVPDSAGRGGHPKHRIISFERKMQDDTTPVSQGSIILVVVDNVNIAVIATPLVCPTMSDPS